MKKLIYLILLLFICCHDKASIKKGQKISKKDIGATIIIENNSDLPIALRREVHYENIDENLYVSEKLLDTFNVNLSIPEFILLSHRNITGDTVIIGSGDTLRVRFEKGEIFIENESNLYFNDKYKELLKNFKNNTHLASLIQQKDSLTLLFRKTIKTKKPVIGRNEYQMFKSYPIEVYRDEYSSRLEEETRLNVMNMKIYQEKKQIINTDTILPDGFKKSLHYRFKKELYNELTFLFNLYNSEAAKKLLDSKIFISDSLLYNHYSKTILLSYLNRNVIKSKSENSRSKQYINYREAYDSVPEYLNDSLSKWARFLSIESMVNYGEQFESVLERYSSFKSKYQDSILNEYLENRYLFDLKRFNSISNDIVLVDKNHKVLSFKEVLKQLEGNFVYVDFWASWCAPCRDAMPFSLDLIEKFADRNFSYVYLSTDQSFYKWEQAIDDEEIGMYPYNYLVLNTDNATFLKDIKLETIPRYILFNQKGQLIHQNSPGPKGKHILDLLENELDI